MLITVNSYATVEVKEKNSVGRLQGGEILRMIIQTKTVCFLGGAIN